MKKQNDFFLTSKLVLIFMFVLAITLIIFFSMTQNIMGIIIFCLIGFVTSFFSKNMIVILLLSIVTTSIITGSACKFSSMEGFAGSSKRDDDDDDEEEEEYDVKVEKYKQEIRDIPDDKIRTVKEQTEKIVNIHQKMITALAKIKPSVQKAQDILDKFKPKSEY